MHRTIIALAAAGTVFASPALARDGQSYIGIDGGAFFPGAFGYVLEPPAGDGREIFIEADNGWEAALVGGHDFGAIRIEVEAAYKVSQQIETVVAPVEFLPGAGTDVGYRTYTPAGGDLDVLSGMVNALLDFGGNTGLGVFAGVGVGVARVRAEIATNNSAERFIDDSDTGLAYQGIAGLRFPIGRTADLGLKYRYFNAPDLNYVDNRGRELTSAFDSHSVLASLVFNLGGAPAAMAPAPLPPVPRPAPQPAPAPMAAPPPPPVVQCNSGPYIVFFEWDEANITPEAASILNSAATTYQNCNNVPIMLAGYTDRSGTVQYNLGLAARRNESVRNYLTSRGIPAARISSDAFGEANPRVPTADGVRELQNRRVEITYGPGSGM